jgi:uncharacterized protein YeaO (DUF488 family)
MSIRIVRLGTPRAKNEGVRIGTVRRPPRGVAKADFARLDYYDVWLPLLSPSPDLVKQGLAAATQADWDRFAKGFLKEMKAPDPSRLLDLLAALSHTGAFSVGCYCEDEARCHRSLLRRLLSERGADVIGA